MPTLYIHIGRGKTGTTAFQQYMGRVSDPLEAQGVYYVASDNGRAGIGHQDLGKSFIPNPPAIMDPVLDPDAVRAAVMQELQAKQPQTAIISSENFAIADAAAVRKFFSDGLPGYRIKIVFVARSQDELAESEYNQIVKLKRESRSLLHYIDHEIEGLDFMETAQAWEAQFGFENMICRIYDAARDSVAQALSCFPEIAVDQLPPAQDVTEPSDANASVGIRGLMVARILNDIEMTDRLIIYQEIFKRLRPVDLPAILLDSAGARAVRERFAASNMAFTERYLGEARADLGGRRYSDEERDKIYAEIGRLGDAIRWQND